MKKVLIHLLCAKDEKGRVSSKNILNAVLWLKNYNIIHTLEAEKTVVEKTSDIDWLNTMLDTLGSDSPLMLNGILKNIWDKYVNNETIIPVHLAAKKIAPDWDDQKIVDLVTFIVNYVGEPSEKAPKESIANPSLEFLESKIKEYVATADSKEYNTIASDAHYAKIIRDGKVVSPERVGSVMQAIANLYLDQSKQVKRLALYKDLSEYTKPEKKS